MRVLIIGAGLGGLTLAHGLRAAGVDTQVFERRPTPADQPSSYGIHLDADGLRALHACLPAENWARLTDSSVPARALVRFHDQRLRALAVRDNETPENTTDPITRRRAISRDALRDALLDGFNAVTHSDADIVQWDKEFSHYEHTPDGRVAAHFTDGSHTVGDLLIGADGSNSRVRGQRLPGLDRIDLDIVNIAGRLPLTDDLAARLPDTLIDGSVNNIVPSGPGWMFVSTWPTPAGTAPDFNLVWAWAAARGSYPTAVENLSPTRWLDHVSTRIAGWAPELGLLVAETDPATLAAIPLRTMPVLPSWTPNTVTLLGDAIHNMTPMAGIGANTALRDADTLRRAITATGDPDLTARVGAYEHQMRTYANEALTRSTRNATNAASEARLPRLAFRSMLRIAEAVPPVKRAMFGPAPIGVASR
ncbi:FAD-dependent oxidoreductase [Nocardia heshunensis]